MKSALNGVNSIKSLVKDGYNVHICDAAKPCIIRRENGG